MKDPYFSSRFDEAAQALREDGEYAKALTSLGIVRDVIVELQKEGASLSLEVRPGAAGCDIAFDGRASMFANGTIGVDGTNIDFAILRGGGSLRLSAFVGQANIATIYLGDAETQKQKVAAMILQVGAQVRLLSDFNIDAAGTRGMSTVKDLSVSPPLKLKNPPKP